MEWTLLLVRQDTGRARATQDGTPYKDDIETLQFTGVGSYLPIRELQQQNRAKVVTLPLL